MFIEYILFAKSLHIWQNCRWNSKTWKSIFSGKTYAYLHNSHSWIEICVSQSILHCRILLTSQNYRWNTCVHTLAIRYLHFTSDFGWFAMFYIATSMGTHLFLLHCVNYNAYHWCQDQKSCFSMLQNFTSNYSKYANFLQINYIL